MTKAVLRKKVHKNIDQADEKTLRLIDALLTEALDIQNEGQTRMTDEQYAEVERRSKSFEVGESKMLSWGKVKSDIRKNYKAKSK
jgi:putative addiction module component (TIGR02574 family)